MRVSLLAAVFAFVLAAPPAIADAPDRAHGISIHMLPKRVADIDGSPWGFVVDFAPYLQPEKAAPVLQSTTDFLKFVRKQTVPVQSNGVWIVISNPAAYSEAEAELLKQAKALCKREHIPLFVARAADLPEGWVRYDTAP